MCGILAVPLFNIELWFRVVIDKNLGLNSY